MRSSIKSIFSTPIQLPNKSWFLISLLGIGILSRLIPHIPNSTATMFCFFMLTQLLRPAATILTVLVMAVISDVLISYFFHYPAFGYWSFFTYTGWISVAVFSFVKPQLTLRNSLFFIFGCSLVFWIWTNLGVWLLSDLYAKTWSGLIVCYVAAIPFLQNELFADLVYVAALTIIFAYQTEKNRLLPISNLLGK